MEGGRRMVDTTPMSNSKCEFIGCKCEAAYVAHKLWGKGGSIRVCEAHKPDRSKASAKVREALKNVPSFYRVEAIK